MWQHLPETSMPTLALGASTLLLVFLLEKFWPTMPGAASRRGWRDRCIGTAGIEEKRASRW